MTYFVALFRFVTAYFALAGTARTWFFGDYTNLVFFTHQTNILIAILFIWGGFASILKGIQPPAWLKGMVTLNIIITGLVAWLVLPPADMSQQLFVLGVPGNVSTHIIVPIMATIDFLLFDEHRRYKWKDALTWLIYFPIYIAFVFTRALVFHGVGPGDGGSPYPYGFINIDMLGAQKVALNCVIYLAIFLVLALIIVAIDKILSKRTPLTGSAPDASHFKKIR